MVRAALLCCSICVVECAADSSGGLEATDADADVDGDADGDGDLSPEGPETIWDPECGSLIPPGTVSTSGHYRLENLCTAVDSVTPCERGGSFDYGLRVVPNIRSLVTFSGGVAGGEGYLAVRNGCAGEPAQCLFDLADDVLTVEAFPGEAIVAHGGPMDTRGCASVSVDLSVWVLECGTEILRVPRDHTFQLAPPEQLLWGQAAEQLLLFRGGTIGRFDLAEAAEPTFGGWVALPSGAHQISSVARDVHHIYLLTRACAQWSGDDAESECIESASYLEVFDPRTFDFVRSERVARDDLEHIAVLGDWLIGIGGGEVSVFDAQELHMILFDGARAAPVEPFVELSRGGEAIVAATRQNIYSIYRMGDMLDLEQLHYMLEPSIDLDVYYGADDFPELVAVVSSSTLTLFELVRLEAAPFLALDPKVEVTIEGEGIVESVTFIDRMVLAVAVSGPQGSGETGSVVVFDLSDPAAPVIRQELETYWGAAGRQVLGYPTRPMTFLVNEEVGIGVVDLSRCP